MSKPNSSRNQTAISTDHEPWVVGVLVEGMSNFGRGITRGVLKYANARREWLIHQDQRGPLVEPSLLPNCDGFICAGIPAETLERLLAKVPNMVSCSSSTDPARMPVVCADGEAIGRLGAEHLIECGLKHFAYFGRQHGASTRRSHGFASALRERGFSYSQETIGEIGGNEKFTHSHWPQLIEWLQTLPKPVGIMVSEDGLASDLAAACRHAGISVPDAVAIVGVNNDDLICESSWPSLSSIEVDFVRVGYLAARQLDEMLRGETIPVAERLIHLPPLRVVCRTSTDISMINDPDISAAVIFIREHACDPCTVNDVLRNTSLNRRRLEQQFSKLLGRTPHEEINRIRMDHAKRLLLETEESLIKISKRCGFSAIQNFSRAFRQYALTTPAAYRRENRKN